MKTSVDKPIRVADLMSALDWREDSDLEFKSARGGVPKSIWETYSAMANTDGGVILLGVEDDGLISGVLNPAKARKTLWDNLNNRGKVSVNLLVESDIVQVPYKGGKVVIAVKTPRASRRQKPVFIGLNPLTGTFRRNYEGDYHCTEEEVGRMLADRSEEPADSRILDGFDLSDLDELSLQQYRQRFSSRMPAHPWLNEDTIGFLRKLGGYRKDRKSGDEGLTVAGLLMFGKEQSIRDAIPGYHVDYRERLSDDQNVRWTDRLTIDGTWTANLFQFYSRVYQRLSQDLKLPFRLDTNLIRQGETIVHEAIREALVNALIHADYMGQGGIVVEKYRDRFEMSNPGTLLISLDQIIQGGVSECRNKALQTMFFMIGSAEKAGSGMDKIRQGWQSQHWRCPSIGELIQPNRVTIILSMISLMPDESLSRLKSQFGRKFERLGQFEVQALVTADVEGEVSNSRMRQISRKHASDLTKILQNLTKNGFLVQKSQGRWTTYHLPKSKNISMIGSEHRRTSSVHKDGDSVHKDGDSVHKDGYSVHKDGDSVHKGWDSSQMLDELPVEELEKLMAIAAPSELGGRLSTDETKRIILDICADRFLTLAHLAELLNRSGDALRHRFIKPMVDEGKIRLKYPDKPNRPDQAYTATVKKEKS